MCYMCYMSAFSKDSKSCTPPLLPYLKSFMKVKFVIVVYQHSAKISHSFNHYHQQYCILFLQFRSFIIRVKEKQLFDNVFILSFITLCKFGTEEIPRNLFLSLCSHLEINAPCQKRSPVPQTKQCVQGDDKGFWSQKKKK